ncbi:MAG: GspMb/PilO family protein [Phycisphaeraceae bacterium]
MTITERDKRTLIIGGVALVILLVGYFGVVPMTQSWVAARERIAVGEVELAQLRQQAALTARERARLATYFGVGARQPVPPLAEARLNLMNDVESILKSANVNIESINPQASRPLREAPHLTRVSLRIDTTCSLVDLARCLARLHESERLILVDRINATVVEDRPGQVKASVVLLTLARSQEVRP